MKPFELSKRTQAFLAALRAGSNAAEAAKISRTADRPMFPRDAAAWLGMTRKEFDALALPTCRIPSQPEVPMVMMSTVLGHMARGAK